MNESTAWQTDHIIMGNMLGMATSHTRCLMFAPDWSFNKLVRRPKKITEPPSHPSCPLYTHSWHSSKYTRWKYAELVYTRRTQLKGIHLQGPAMCSSLYAGPSALSVLA